jgi:hypothetical protein
LAESPKKKKTLQRQGLNVQRFHHENSKPAKAIGWMIAEIKNSRH